MNLAERAHQRFVGRIIFPASNYLLNRKNILSCYRELLETEQAPRQVLRELQLQKLQAVIRHAYLRSPFYSSRFREAGLVPEDIKAAEDVRRIPKLVRKDVVEQGSEMVDNRFQVSIAAADRAAGAVGAPVPFAAFRRHRLVRNTSSGSTGTPTVFYEDGSTAALNWAHELRLKAWFGVAPGAREARMSATSTEYAALGKAARAREWLWNQMVLPGYFLSDREYEICVARIRKFRPRVLWGPTQALTGLAQHVRRENLNLTGCLPDLVISRAAPLHGPEKKRLESVFSCPATNIYGTREVGHVAMSCAHGSMHVNEENYLVEIERDGVACCAGTPDAAEHGPGKILITPLFESPMPFLRYEIGDLAELGEAHCPCGRTLVTLRKVMGRVGDVLQTRDGRLIEPAFWCIVFEDGRPSRDVEKYQVIYRRNDSILIRIVPRPTYSGETEAELRRFLSTNLPAGIHFEFERVSDIPPRPSGKYLFVVNEITPQEAQSVLR